MSYTIDTSQKSETYISKPGASVADRAYFISAPKWKEKHTSVARQGSVFQTVGGGVIVQSYPRLTAGLPVTLEGDEKHGLIFTTEADKLKEMVEDGVELEFSDDDGATRYKVFPDWDSGPLDLRLIDGYYRMVMTGTVYLIRG
jgi:hypothetical protein